MAVTPREAPIDQEALHQALLERISTLRGYVASQISPRHRSLISPDDILQEVWLVVRRTSATFRPDGPNAIDRWLITLANSVLYDAFRAARRLKRGGNLRRVQNAHAAFSSYCGLFERIAGPGRTPSREVHAVEAGHAVLIALERLSDAQREVVKMHYIEGLSHGEIAERLDKTTAAVNSLLYRGLRELRRMLGDAAKYFSDARSAESTR